MPIVRDSHVKHIVCPWPSYILTNTVQMHSCEHFLASFRWHIGSEFDWN